MNIDIYSCVEVFLRILVNEKSNVSITTCAINAINEFLLHDFITLDVYFYYFSHLELVYVLIILQHQL